jgi:N-formylglutamate amidohydrolase
MNRASDRETRLVALERQVHEILQSLENMAADIHQLRESRDLIVDTLLKFNRELGAQREKYPL